MKKLAAIVVLSSLFALPAFAALKLNDTARISRLRRRWRGKAFDFSLKNALKKGPVVVYFYPSAYTGGCNIEAHSFAENKAQFEAAGATIIGVSGDSIGRLNDFSADPEYCAGKFPVASDADGAISKSYDLSVRTGKAGMKDTRGNDIDHAFTERTTFVISQTGKIVATLSSADDKIAPGEHADKSLEIVQHLAAAKHT